ncbi:putative clathrin assembly protein At4g40080 isoform X1 [Prosopis cineraria]|uniref:putative clathrin assembly protein At4g40080 isoform X1 n=1 Tax=Prosopis cineraria TaxID=364024 RepID=UPI0024105EE8|nr:putative clathrin assembly protein At4g40080 isoform X1 [Prosopis cineraria]
MAKLKNLIGVMKDKASQGKAALLSKRATLSLLRATSHDSFTPPTPKHLSTLLSLGDGSRAAAAPAIELLMDRLQKTHNSAVALKCLIAVHHIIKHGTFILQDQLSVYPASGGRNYLKLSNFRDNSSSISWELSSWVRWYAQYTEQLLCTSRALGFFLGSNSSSDAESQGERVSGLMNADLLGETDALVALIDEIGRKPDCESTKGNRLVEEIENLVGEDWISIMKEVRVRVKEFRERLGCLSFGEAVELVYELKRMEESKGMRRMVAEQSFWDFVREVKEEADQEILREEIKGYKTVRRHRASESDRFARSILSSADYLRFPSGRLL